jgi:hypothetical protein
MVQKLVVFVKWKSVHSVLTYTVLDLIKTFPLPSVVLCAVIQLNHSVDRLTSKFTTVAATSNNASINAPAGATHFRFINAIGVVSDFAFNDATGTYEPTNPELNELSNTTYGAYTPLNAAYAGEVLDASLPVGTVMTADVSVLQLYWY